ncbi:hypothetical protein Mal64_15630 [Pseudobythopirellula maris]|uniref:DUF3891 domain-containing protein n=1 Tax=Pseudobythopirellula maris TaxID=2527991 RepID=A0A5C5ZMK3_9BACT|nr:DUF3891 family protein [Pseudobythopirellula maris]TWT88091.1 hypothetical protein Mal64_15630 [Pseudobythopirellula maris]
MIRRDEPLGAAEPTHWLLVSQREHARISYELAAAWEDLGVEPPAVRDELLQAIRHHDDGWAVWEGAPGIDPETLRPYAFTEMPPAEAQRIWTASIDACRQIGPLAGWAAAGHFITLQSPEDDDHQEWAPWLAEQEAQHSAWLAEWLAASPAHTPELAERCLQLLRAFDWLSLWLCCLGPQPGDEVDGVAPLVIENDSPRIGPWTVDAVAEQGEWRFIMDPWPFVAQAIELRVWARRVPVRRYADAEALLAASHDVELQWDLRAGPPASDTKSATDEHR